MYAVIDLETTAKTCYKRKANPFDSENRIVAVGFKTAEDRDVTLVYEPYNFLLIDANVTTLVGHNLKFDLLYLWKYPAFQSWLKNGGKVWDTQLVEHILSGQQSGMTSLNDLSLKYGGTLKDDKVTQMFKAGYGAQDVPKELLLEYLKHDILNTEIVLKAQVKRAKAEGQFKLIQALMDSYLATTEMEFNGMYVNKDILGTNKAKIRTELEGVMQDLNVAIAHSNWPKEIEFNFDSKDHLSALIYGGTLKYKTIEVVRNEDGTPYKFKTGSRAGEIRQRSVEKYIECKGYVKKDKAEETKKEGVFVVGESTLHTICSARSNPAFIRDFSSKLLEYRRLAKLYSTYYEAIEELRMEDGLIHHQLNHVTTLTGRLSSRNPNMQNIPSAEESDVKQVFTSRYGDEGIIMEFDYSQLEVAVLAFLSQDEVLIEELKNGVDMHLENAALLYNKSTSEVTDKERKLTKRFTFGLTYGQQAYGMADANGVSKEVAQEFIDKFYSKYTGIRRYHEQLIQEMKFSRQPTTELLAPGIQKGKAVLKSLTGRKYVFWESMKQNYYGTKIGFSEPDIKNYPVQGLATGDIVPIMVGKLFRTMIEFDSSKSKLVNTIHDSVMLDSEKLGALESIITKILEAVPETMKEIFNIDFNVPISVDAKYGKSWWHSEMGIN